LRSSSAVSRAASDARGWEAVHGFDMSLLRRLIATYGAAIDVFDRVFLVVVSLSLGVVVLLTGVEIVGRNVFKSSSPAAVDITLSLAVFVYLAGYLVLLNRDQDVMMDYFYRRFRPRTKAMIDALTALGCLVFFAILLLKSITLFKLGLHSLHPVFPIPHGVVVLPVLIAGAGCLLVAIRKSLDSLLALHDAFSNGATSAS
jgi:TRAP-type C4-dicarboxylate transport system permease small subunit